MAIPESWREQMKKAGVDIGLVIALLECGGPCLRNKKRGQVLGDVRRSADGTTYVDVTHYRWTESPPPGQPNETYSYGNYGAVRLVKWDSEARHVQCARCRNAWLVSEDDVKKLSALPDQGKPLRLVLGKFIGTPTKYNDSRVLIF